MNTGTTGTNSSLDLDDAEAILTADTEGLLRGAASGGAQVRDIVSAVAEGALSELGGFTPRSVLLLADRGPAREAAALAQEMSAHTGGIPVMSASTTPRWVGPLDVVVVLADDPGDMRLADSVDRAARRGATVVMITPPVGPVAAAGGGRAIRLPPRVAVPAGMTFARFLAAGWAALVHVGAVPVADLSELADRVDTDSAGDHPSRESFASPAKTFAARVAGRHVVLAGAGAASTVLSGHLAASLLRFGGISVAAVDMSVVQAAQAASRTIARDRMDALFHDPVLDGPNATLRPRVLLVASASERVAAEQHARVLADCEVVTATPPGIEPTGGVLAEFLVLACRVQTAAVYLGLVR